MCVQNINKLDNINNIKQHYLNKVYIHNKLVKTFK